MIVVLTCAEVVAVGFRLEVFASVDAAGSWQEVAHPPGIRILAPNETAW